MSEEQKKPNEILDSRTNSQEDLKKQAEDKLNETLRKIQEKTVPIDMYQELVEKYKQALDTIEALGTKGIEMEPKEQPRTKNDIIKSITAPDKRNIDIAKDMLELRELCLKENNTDIFGENGEEVFNALNELLGTSDNDADIFNTKLNNTLNEPHGTQRRIDETKKMQQETLNELKRKYGLE